MPSLVYGPKQTNAYISYEVAPNFSVVSRILKNVRTARGEDFNPETVLDFGSGSGASLYAAREVFGSTLQVT